MFHNIEVEWAAKDPVRRGANRGRSKAAGFQKGGGHSSNNDARGPGDGSKDAERNFNYGESNRNRVFLGYGGDHQYAKPGANLYKEGDKCYDDPPVGKQLKTAQHPRQMKREPNIPTKRAQQQQSTLTSSCGPPQSSSRKKSVSRGEERWNCGVMCADRDLLNQELDNRISKYRKNTWSKEPMYPDATLVGADKRGKRITHEKLQPRARMSAQTNGPVINFEREQKMFYCPEESIIHSGRRQHSDKWDPKGISFDVYEQERARPHTTAAEKRRVRSSYSDNKASSYNNYASAINVMKPELSICGKS